MTTIDLWPGAEMLCQALGLDRSEIRRLVYVADATHPAGERVEITYVAQDPDVPPATRLYAVRWAGRVASLVEIARDEPAATAGGDQL